VNVALGDGITSADNGSVTAIGVNQYAATLNSKGTAVTGFEYGQGWNCTAAGTATFTAAPGQWNHRRPRRPLLGADGTHDYGGHGSSHRLQRLTFR